MAGEDWDELLEEEREELGAYDEEDDEDEEAPLPSHGGAAHATGDQAAYFAEPIPQEEAPAGERLQKLLETMPGQADVLTKAVAYCRERKPSAEVIAAIEGWQRYNRSVYAPATLLALLEKAGGLEHVNEDGSPFEQSPQGAGEAADGGPAGQADADADAAAGDEGAPAAGEAPVGAEAAGSAEAAAQTPAAGADAAAPDSDEAAAGSGAGETGEAPDEEAPAGEPRPSWWAATPAGLEMVAARDPRSRASRLLVEEEQYLPVYKELLEALADGPMAKRDIDVIVKANPASESPRRLGGYFVDRLEKAGAIEWAGAWTITEVGRELLDDEALYR